MRATRRITSLTVPVDGRSGVAFEAYPGWTPLLTNAVARPALLVTLTMPQHVDEGHVRIARDLAVLGRRYAIEVDQSWRGLPSLSAASRASASGAAVPAGDATTGRDLVSGEPPEGLHDD